MKLAIVLFTCLTLFNGGSSLKCYICSSNDRTCQNGQASSLETCETSQLYCVKTEVTATLENGTEIVNIALSCQDVELTGCIETQDAPPIKSGKSCFTSCSTDGCNRLTVAESTKATEVTTSDEYTTAVTEMREIDTTQEDSATPTTTRASDDGKRKGLIPTIVEEVDVETTTAAKESTTSGAQTVGVPAILIFNLFATTLIAVLL